MVVAITAAVGSTVVTKVGGPKFLQGELEVELGFISAVVQLKVRQKPIITAGALAITPIVVIAIAKSTAVIGIVVVDESRAEADAKVMSEVGARAELETTAMAEVEIAAMTGEEVAIEEPVLCFLLGPFRLQG